VTRRLNTDPSAIREFVLEGGSPEDWIEPEDNATEAVFGGAVVLESATTSGIILRLTAAAPAGVIDDNLKRPVAANTSSGDVRQSAPFLVHDDGQVTLTRSTVDVLKIEGLPEPEDGQAGLRTERLEQLQALAAASGATVQVQRTAALSDGGARHLKVQLVGLPRHASRILAPIKPDTRAKVASRLPLSGPAHEIWLPATRRPAPPDVHSLEPTFSWSDEEIEILSDRGFLKRIERRTLLRLYLRRPWFSSGEGERVGLVIWPPEILRNGDEIENLTDVMPDLLEEDLGPAGRFVSAWGLDPIRGWATTESNSRLPIFIQRDAFRTTSNPALWHPRVLMPVAGAESGTSIETFAQVSLLSYKPRFDLREDLWYLDIDVDVGLTPEPFIRLGVVRYQPNAREDKSGVTTGSRGIRCSPPSVAWAQVMPFRRLAATWVRSSNGTEVSAVLSGPGALAQKEPKPTPAVRFRVVKYRAATGRAPSQEIQARGSSEEILCWESWKGDPSGNQRMFKGESTWTALFQLAEKIEESDWKYSVTAEEFDRMPGTEDADPRDMQESGTRFFGRIDLTREKTLVFE
jgi:hypothetical protein